MDDFPEDVLEESRKIPGFSGDYEDISGVNAFAADDPGVQDPDDAISLESAGDTYRLGIHISLVSYFVKPGTRLDEEAKARTVSLYTPEETVYMFPRDLIQKRLCLSPERPTPVLSAFAHIDDDGVLHRIEIKLGQLKLARKFTYSELSRAVRSDPQIRALYALSVSLSEQRAMAGGALIPIPYLKVKETPEGLRIEKVVPDSPDQLVVTEPMILYNHIMAKFLSSKKIPGAYRHQPEEHGKPPSPEHPLYPVKAIYALKKSHLSPTPKPHKGLGFSAYLQATSPLRRFTDLVNQRQIQALLENREPPYSKKDMNAMLPGLEEREREARSRQREAVVARVARHLEGQAVRGIISSKRKGGKVFLPDYLITLPLGEAPERMKEGARIRVVVRDAKAFPQR